MTPIEVRENCRVAERRFVLGAAELKDGWALASWTRQQTDKQRDSLQDEQSQSLASALRRFVCPDLGGWAREP